MSTRTGSYHRITLVAAAAAVAVAYGAAAAEPMTEVIVEAPRVVHSTDRVRPVGGQIDIASVRYRVSYADLNLATHTGAVALEERVNDAAKRACKQLETAAAPNATAVAGDPPCLKTAVDGAMKQVREAVAAAEKQAQK
jgi:UrcA family protein